MSIFGIEETAMGRMAIDILAYLGEMLADYLVGSTKKIGNIQTYIILLIPCEKTNIYICGNQKNVEYEDDI